MNKLVPTLNADLVNDIREIYIPTPQSNRVFMMLDRIVRYSRKGQLMPCGYVLGESHSGKSSAIQQFIKDGRVEDVPGKGIQRDYLYIEIQETGNANILTVLRQILKALGAEDWDKGTKDDLIHRVKTLLEKQAVQIVFLDEFQQLIENKTSQSVAYKVADWIKGFLTEGVCPFVIAGTPNIEDILAKNDQLISRSRYMVKLEPFALVSSEDLERYLTFIELFLDKTPVRFEDLLSETMLRRLHAATDGMTGKVGKFLAHAAEIANERFEEGDGPAVVGIQDMAAAWAENRIAGHGRLNPFLISVEELAEMQREAGRVRTSKKRGA
ncbi:TniB family NTP-binding protein [Lacibacterium aquatile]|uniref:TniB family NTP-binding protein n=1 Tax=Lacibacterium aquatile TaxID=1168082 RepID=A0ABW5DR57_9PROT